MHSYRRLLRYARPQRRFFLLIFVLTLGTSVLAALQPWPLKLLIDHALGGEPMPEWFGTAMPGVSGELSGAALVGILACGALVIFLSAALLDAGLAWSWTVAGQRMVYRLAEELFGRLQRRSLAYHQRRSVGDVMKCVTSDSWCVHQVVDNLLFAPGHAILTLSMLVLLMAQRDGTLTWLSVVLAPFMVGASFLLGRPLRAAARLKRDIDAKWQSHLQQTLTGIPVVQAFVQEDREQARFQAFADAALRVQHRSVFLGSLNSLGSGLITVAGTGVVLWAGAHAVVAERITVGDLLLFLIYLGLLQAQVRTLANVYPTLQGLGGSVDRVMEVLESEPEIAEVANARPLTRARGAVGFEGVTFGYEEGRPVLREITVSVEPGETVAIVGPTGAGKSTLAGLVPRFYDPWSGRVTLDGRDLRELRLGDVRNQVSLVMQEAFLFSMPVLENIGMGRPGATREEIEEAARAARADEFIRRLPRGYDTVLGERGVTLSGGERQRLSIARALLKDAPVLILDEPTSALDAETEQSILAATVGLMGGRTTFLIAHRLSTIRGANRVLVLEGGRLAECGTPEELMKRGGLFARLQATQAGHAAEGGGQ